MPNNYYQKHKQRLRKEAHEKYQNLSEEEKKTKGERRPKKDIKSLLKKKKKKSISINVNVIKVFLRNKKRN